MSSFCCKKNKRKKCFVYKFKSVDVSKSYELKYKFFIFMSKTFFHPSENQQIAGLVIDNDRNDGSLLELYS